MLAATKKALIIDDEQDICLLLAAILRKNDFLTDFANTLGEASGKLSAFGPEVIFLDLNLPDGNGFNLIPEIRKKLPEAKIVVCSAYDGPKEQNRARREGAHAFVGKPLERSALQVVIDQFSNGHSKD